MTKGELAPKARYYARLRRNAAIGLLIVLVWLAFGSLVYGACAPRGNWFDAIRHAAMLVAGMGPVAEIESDGCKMFDALYALVSAFGILAVAGYAFAPWLHRVLHRFHLEDSDAPK